MADLGCQNLLPIQNRSIYRELTQAKDRWRVVDYSFTLLAFFWPNRTQLSLELSLQVLQAIDELPDIVTESQNITVLVPSRSAPGRQFHSA
jgi:hypothetical protein